MDKPLRISAQKRSDPIPRRRALHLIEELRERMAVPIPGLGTWRAQAVRAEQAAAGHEDAPLQLRILKTFWKL